MSSNEGNISWYAPYGLEIVCLSGANAFSARRTEQLVYGQETRRFHISVIQNAVDKTIQELESHNVYDGQQILHNDSIVILDARSCSGARMHTINRFPLARHMEVRIIGDCEPFERRANALLSRLRETTRPNMRMLVEMEIAASSKRGMSLLVEMIRRDEEWIPSSSVLRVE